ncbi:LON peptidase substrate-binding domain-containing protein [bacterium]|jgi:ATP-dependent Lon protease|nr:LON peptidase substrate-binding domain-containing protein [bacterium]
MSEILPIFPLRMVLFPGCRVSLHIFEDRYKQMITECVEDETEFALILGQDDDFNDVGCSASVVEVINRLPDGRMNIIIKGVDRIRVIERHADKPYITGEIERVADVEDEPKKSLAEKTRALYAEALQLSIGWYRAPKEEGEPAGSLSYTIASTLGMPIERQQALLELTSVQGRFQFLKEMLENTLSGLREHSRKVTGNGKAH